MEERILRVKALEMAIGFGATGSFAVEVAAMLFAYMAYGTKPEAKE